jgi:TM2 domain-containing membrane protein YozV
MPCKTCGFGGAQIGMPCPKCGTVEQPSVAVPGGGQTIIVQQGPGAAAMPQKSRLAAGLLGIFFGGLGVHRFYLGYTGIGALMLILQVIGWLTMCLFIGFFLSIPVGIWGTIEGILILVGVMNRDAFGRPLT